MVCSISQIVFINMVNYSLRCVALIILAGVLSVVDCSFCRLSAADEVRTIVQQGHYIYDYDISADGKYAVSVNTVSIHYDSGRDVLMLHDGRRFITSDAQGGINDNESSCRY